MGIGLDMLTEFAVLIACFRLPKLFPKEYKNSTLKIDKNLLYVLLCSVGVLMLGTSYVNLADLSGPIYIAIILYLVFVFALTQICYKHYQKHQRQAD